VRPPHPLSSPLQRRRPAKRPQPLVVAKDIGQETVQYVSNIYKYYVAYKMTIDQLQTCEQAKQTVKPK